MTHLIRDRQPLETWGASTYRPPGMPQPPPAGFMWKNAEHFILETPNSWTIHTRWWEPDEAVWRDYYKVVTDTGMLCYIYHDRLRGGWYLERIFD